MTLLSSRRLSRSFAEFFYRDFFPIHRLALGEINVLALATHRNKKLRKERY